MNNFEDQKKVSKILSTNAYALSVFATISIGFGIYKRDFFTFGSYAIMSLLLMGALMICAQIIENDEKPNILVLVFAFINACINFLVASFINIIIIAFSIAFGIPYMLFAVPIGFMSRGKDEGGEDIEQ